MSANRLRVVGSLQLFNSWHISLLQTSCFIFSHRRVDREAPLTGTEKPTGDLTWATPLRHGVTSQVSSYTHNANLAVSRKESQLSRILHDDELSTGANAVPPVTSSTYRPPLSNADSCANNTTDPQLSSTEKTDAALNVFDALLSVVRPSPSGRSAGIQSPGQISGERVVKHLPVRPAVDIVQRNVTNIRIIEEMMHVPLRLRPRCQRGSDSVAGYRLFDSEREAAPVGNEPSGEIMVGQGLSIHLKDEACPPSSAALDRVRSKRNELLRAARDHQETSTLIQKNASEASVRARTNAVGEEIIRIASWHVTVMVVRAFLSVVEHSVTVQSRARESQRHAAGRILAVCLPRIFKRYKRRKIIRRWLHATAVLLGAVRFKDGLRRRSARIIGSTLKRYRTDPALQFKRSIHLVRTVRRLTSRMASFRSHLVALLRRQWAAMELYVMLTRPELVLTAAELRTVRGIRSLSGVSADRVIAALKARAATRRAVALGSTPLDNRDGATVPHTPNFVDRKDEGLVDSVDFNPDLGKFTFVPLELVALAYGDAAYFDFLTEYRRYCVKARIPLIPPALSSDHLAGWTVSPALREREIARFTKTFFRRQNQAIWAGISTHYATLRSAHDLLETARRSQISDAETRVKEKYPSHVMHAKLYRTLVEIEVKANTTPLVQALHEKCSDILNQRIPCPLRHRALFDPLVLQSTVEHHLWHAKLLRVLTVTGTEVPRDLI